MPAKWRLVLMMGMLIVVAVGRSAAPDERGDWPQWRGPQRNGSSAETGLLKEWPAEGPALLWKTPGIGGGYGSVAVAGGKVYCIGDKGGGQAVTCLDADGGKQLWSTVVRKGGNGSRSTPTIDGDRLYVVTSSGNQEGGIVCLNAKTGKRVWEKDFQEEFQGRMQTSWGYSESPLIDGAKVVCTPGGPDAAIVALDKKTGDTIWKAKVEGDDAAAYASIVATEVGGVHQYVQLMERGIVGVAAKDGKFLWRYDRVANGTANIPTALVKGDLVFCSSGYNTGAALLQIIPTDDGFAIKEKYFLDHRKFQNHHGGMVLVGDHVYAGHGHNQGAPICVELKTGKTTWHEDRGPGTGSAAVVYADGHLYFRYENAVMALIEATPEGYQLKSKFRIPDGGQPSWPHPAVAGGRLYLRDQNQMYCYDIKAP